MHEKQRDTGRKISHIGLLSVLYLYLNVSPGTPSPSQASSLAADRITQITDTIPIGIKLISVGRDEAVIT